ncbi:hypothetical protein MNBD_GAMMA21-2643 [hydrothermal vent metagenome]|uniref:Mechanosensitive ion channel n=1 Tax=hydrothermal vent metagenome TaxID=652676 RepID=A0A3B1APX4_9ZZZZ
MEKTLQSLTELLFNWAPDIGIAIGILLAFYILSRAITKIINSSQSRFDLDPGLVSLVRRTNRITLFVLAVLTALGTLGVNISAMVAGLGLTGFALGFALKDTISNLLSGVLILLYRPFQIGSVIKVGSFEGEVVGIDLRYTVLNSGEKKILIPNSKLFTDPIIVLNGDAVNGLTDPDNKD